MAPELFAFVKAIGLVTAGLALFLYGLEHFAQVASQAVTDNTRRILASLTKSRFRGLITGAVTTAVLQSSSSMSVIVVGLIEAGTIGFRQSVPVLVGANIGTTVTTQLIAFKLTDWGGVILALGFLMSLMPGRAKTLGKLAFYFGFVFFGLSILADQLAPIASQDWVTNVLRQVTDPYTFVAVGLVLTAVVQSSSVVTGLAVVLLQTQFISFEASVGLVIGSNAGTTITMWLASRGMSITARRAALAHIFFNIGGALIFLPVLHLFALVLLQLPLEDPARLATGHALFNVVLAVITLVLLTPFMRVIERIVRT